MLMLDWLGTKLLYSGFPRIFLSILHLFLECGFPPKANNVAINQRENAVRLVLSVRQSTWPPGTNPETLPAKEVAPTSCELCPPVRHCLLMIYVSHYRHNELFIAV